MERKILSAALHDREVFNKLNSHLEQNDLGPEARIIWDQIAEFYGIDPQAPQCDRELLADRIRRSLTSDKLAGFVLDVLGSLGEVSEPNVVAEVQNLRRANLGSRIASLLATNKMGDEVDRLMNEYQSLATTGDGGAGEESVVFNGQEVKELCATSFDKSALIKIAPKSLNDHLDGGAKPGHHILVFAPTEMGKSLFAINMTCGFLSQSLPVLYIGNEDPAADILMRVINRLTGMTKQQVISEPGTAQKLLDQRNYKLLTVAALAPGTFPEVRELCSRYMPKVVILDQLRNMDVKSENRTQALERAATEARNLAKSLNVLVVSVTQAADSASGKRILNRGDVDSSNVGIPGQADVMIGIGADSQQEDQNIRVLSFPKNKLSGRHQPITVSIDPLLSKVIDHVS